MSDPITLARSARESLARGLAALQQPGVPPQVMNVAEPIARAMGALHQIEASHGAALPQHAPVALEAARSSLQQLQAQMGVHPAVDQATEAVAGCLSSVHMLSQSAAQPHAAPQQHYQQPQYAQQPQQHYQQPQYAQQPQQYYQQPQYAQQPQQSQGDRDALAIQQTQFADSGAVQAAAHQAAAQYGQPPPQGMQAPPQAAMGQPQHSAGTVSYPPDANGVIRVEAALGAHSTTNFFKGLSGNDVIDSGGIFIATYQIPDIGAPLLIKVSMPGGYEFEAQGVVTWTREVPMSTAGPESPPGYGAKFTQISNEGRQLVYRYVRNREPLFHDDL